MRNKPVIIAIVALFIVVVIGLVYATFTQSLNINGTANVRNSKWKIYFSKIEKYGSWSETAIELTSPVINQDNPTTIDDYVVSLTTPGDSISYLVEVTNDGDYDAVLSDYTINTPRCKANDSESDTSAINTCSKLNYSIKYQSGASLQKNIDILKSKQKAYFILTLSYANFDDASLLPTDNVLVDNLGVELVYTQEGKAKTNSDGTTPLITYDAYAVGDRIQVAGDTTGDYYRVLVDSPKDDDYVVALKENPLTVDEVNTYGGVGTDNNHVNMYVTNDTNASYYHQAYDQNGYGGMAYYGSANCGYGTDSNQTDLGCTTSYDASEIKYVVDGWSQARFTQNQLKTVNNYIARLATKEELQPIGWSSCSANASSCNNESTTPTWLYAPNYEYWYWTMSQWYDSGSLVWYVDINGDLNRHRVSLNYGVVRPVINLYKSKIK